MQFTHLKCAIRWFVAFSQSATITTVSFRTLRRPPPWKFIGGHSFLPHNSQRQATTNISASYRFTYCKVDISYVGVIQ